MWWPATAWYYLLNPYKPPVSPTSPPTVLAEHAFGMNGNEQMYCIMPAGNPVHCSASYGTCLNATQYCHQASCCMERTRVGVTVWLSRDGCQPVTHTGFTSRGIRFHENRFFSQANGWIATTLAHDGSQPGLHPGCAQSQGRGQRSRDMGTSVMSQIVYYTVLSHVLSLHALTLWSTITFSFQYKYQAARSDVLILEWATPSLTVWFSLQLIVFVYVQFSFLKIRKSSVALLCDKITVNQHMQRLSCQ